jgi:hypothetical protein
MTPRRSSHRFDGVTPDAFHSDHGGWRDQAMPAQRGGQALDKCGEQHSVDPIQAGAWGWFFGVR